MLSADAFFQIGSTHKICQDYVVASPNGDYVILSDGCSSALDTDIGARLLVRSVQAFVYLEDERAMLAYGLARADACARTLHLPRPCLLATLLIARKRGDYIETIVAGDGVIAARRKEDGALFIYEYKYDSGAPFYLSYTLAQEMLGNYRSTFAQTRKCSRMIVYQPIEWSIGEKVTLPEIAFFWEEGAECSAGPVFHLNTFDQVCLFSDGVTSFSSESGPLPTIDVVREFTRFKTLKGEFVQRRCWRALDDFRRNNQAPADDFSMAAIASVLEDRA